MANKQNDGDELVPLVEQIKELTGEYPEQVSADASYCSESNIEAMEEREVDAYIATGRQKHGSSSPTSGEDKRKGLRTQKMREKLREGGFEGPYRLRKRALLRQAAEQFEITALRDSLEVPVRGEEPCLCQNRLRRDEAIDRRSRDALAPA